MGEIRGGAGTRRVLFAGNAAAACRCIPIVSEAVGPAGILAVAPPGGALHDWQEPFADRARLSGIRTLEPDDVNAPAAIEQLSSFRPDLVLSVGYTQLFRPELLGAVGAPVVNVHPSLLPRHRGVAPLVWTIVEGDASTGVTAHRVDAGVDTGPVLIQQKLPIHPDESGFELHQKAARLSAAVVAQLLRDWLASGTLPAGHAQVGDGSVHRARDGTLNAVVLDDRAERVRNVVRALRPPFPGAHVEIGGRRVVLGRVELLNGACPPGRGSGPTSPEARFATIDGSVALRAADGWLLVTEWFDGGRLRPGDELARELPAGSP